MVISAIAILKIFLSTRLMRCSFQFSESLVIRLSMAARFTRHGFDQFPGEFLHHPMHLEVFFLVAVEMILQKRQGIPRILMLGVSSEQHLKHKFTSFAS